MMTITRRSDIYCRQNDRPLTGLLTPRQQRRFTKKFRREAYWLERAERRAERRAGAR